MAPPFLQVADDLRPGNTLAHPCRGDRPLGRVPFGAGEVGGAHRHALDLGRVAVPSMRDRAAQIAPKVPERAAQAVSASVEGRSTVEEVGRPGGPENGDKPRAGLGRRERAGRQVLRWGGRLGSKLIHHQRPPLASGPFIQSTRSPGAPGRILSVGTAMVSGQRADSSALPIVSAGP